MQRARPPVGHSRAAIKTLRHRLRQAMPDPKKHETSFIICSIHRAGPEDPALDQYVVLELTTVLVPSQLLLRSSQTSSSTGPAHHCLGTGPGSALQCLSAGLSAYNQD
jgi:hypothetical protein